MGIETEDMEEVFRPFHRLSNYGEPGLGIGLSTVKRLVERNFRAMNYSKP